ncbi:MAG: 4Fe-4S binding protein [Deltaproteobacteria bacterium]|nr:4Fe-4S binding protein [Deltaproteobacteria bacterium]
MDGQAQQRLMATYRDAWRSRGIVAWLVSIGIVAVYVTLYFTDVLDPPAAAIGLESKWFLYSFVYSAAMIAGAWSFLRRHGNSRYQRVRTYVNVGVQVLLGFCVPFAMKLAGQKDFYLSYFWPLKIDYLFPTTLRSLPVYLVLYAMLGSLVAVPLLTIYFGKRWYCSWVCGCGALANTIGDPWRHLSSKSTAAWRLENVTVYAVLALAVSTTAVVAGNQFLGPGHGAFSHFASQLQHYYFLVVASVLAGVVGTGLYPILGTRVWCRYFCPMAALLGLVQKLGRFRIAVKPDMCISCGNCSTYCEMGIDVRSYAQSNQSFTRASCVGCGMCAHVCPRGVLRLENRWPIQGDKKQQSLPVVDF